jgi:tetratricopeptide (TPR) repeat protein/parvulin-like peptidyl-prolyl isomerase
MKSVKRRQKIVIWVLVGGFVASIVAAGGLGLLRSPEEGSPEETVLVVDGRRTTRQEFAQAYGNLIEYYRQLYAAYGMDFEPLLRGTEGAFRSLQFQAEAAEGIIRLVILDQAARELRVTIPRAELDKAVSAQYQSLLTQYRITEQQLEEYLRYQRSTLDAFKKDLARGEESRLREERVRQLVVGPVEPTDADLSAYYGANQGRYQTEPEKIQVGYILVREARLADELLGKANDPQADFAALAKAYSLDEATRDTDGQTNWFSRNESPFSAKVTDAIWPAEVGQVKLVDDDAGFHIVKLLGRRAAVVPPLAEVRETVKADYIRDQEGKRWDAWYTARRERIAVKVVDPVVAAAMAYQTDKGKALAELVGARDAGTSNDPYLLYYIGRLREDLLTAAAAKRVEIEKKTERAPEEEAELARLRAEEADHKAQALAAYLAFIETGERDEPFFQRVLSIEPQNPPVRYALAEMYREAGQWVQAEAEYRRAVEAKPDFVDAHIGQGDVSLAMELYNRAIEAYRKAIEIRPASLTLRLKLAAAYLQDGQPAQAQPLLQEVLGREPDNATALTLFGDLLLAQGDTAGAIARYEAAYRRSPTSDALLKLAGGHLAAGKVEDAKRRYEEAIRRFPHRSEAHLGLGDVLLTLGERDRALTSYRQALRLAVAVSLQETIARKIVDLDPSDVGTRYRLAGYFREQYKYDPAIRQYEAILALSPGHLDALIGLGDCYLAKVEYDRALDYYRQALAVAPTAQQKLPIYDQMVAVEEGRAGTGNPVGAQGLEILWQRAQLHRELAQFDRAIADLERIVSADTTFRAEEVASLLATLRAQQPR